MERIAGGCHHRKLFWIAAAMGLVGLLLLLAPRITALSLTSSMEASGSARQYSVAFGEKLGLSLLAVGAGFFMWAWHLMSKGSRAQPPSR